MADITKARQGIPSERKEKVYAKNELRQKLVAWVYQDKPRGIAELEQIRAAQDIDTLRELTASRLQELQTAIKYLLMEYLE